MVQRKWLLPTLIDHRLEGEAGTEHSSSGLPSVLAEKGVQRLRVVSITALILILIGWVLVNVIEGQFLLEFETPWQWGGPIAVILASAAMLSLASTKRIAKERIVNLGLFYQVVMSFALAIGDYWSTFREMPSRWLTSDVVGYSIVAIWMLCFTMLVPARPRNALIALLGSAAAVPLTILGLMRAGDIPAMAPPQFLFAFCLPYLICAGVAYYSARILYGLGRELRRAQEMGSYHLLDLLGRGGMGEVWRARHKLLARPAAIKLISRTKLAGDPGMWENLTERFEKEAQATAALQSPHTVSLYDYGAAADGSLYYVMEFLEGIDLESLVERFGPQEPGRTIHILRQACRSLDEAHRRGLVHRDIKPGNIYLCRQAFEYDFVKVLDFGLVKRVASFAGAEEAGGTAIGMITGTPAYIAPEIAHGGSTVDGRADIYALGCVAFWLLTGRQDFEEESPLATIIAHTNKAPTPAGAVSELDIPSALDDLVLGCLAKNPEERPAAAAALHDALGDVRVEPSWTQARAGRWWESHLAPNR
jgi:hypothetical protein